MSAPIAVAGRVEQDLHARNALTTAFFDREAPRLALACREMSERFLRGGRLLAFGRGPYATDAQHVSVEFVHPVIVGKRALPALDLSLDFRPWVEALVRPDDMVMGFAPPEGDAGVAAALAAAARAGAMTFSLTGESAPRGDRAAPAYGVPSPTDHPFLHQELVEILYHTLWETVHVFFEHRELGHDVGNAGFLYPFLGKDRQESPNLLDEVAASIRMKVQDDAALRLRVAAGESDRIAEATGAIHDRLTSGGAIILFGNGGSATDCNDWAIDCVDPPAGWRPLPALSLAMEPANLSAIANDVGTEVIFVRQLIAQAKPADIAIGISTSGGSKNVIAALAEARRRGLLTVALLGYDGGEIRRGGLADHTIVVASDYIPRIQEVQASIYHIIREHLEALARGEG